MAFAVTTTWYAVRWAPVPGRPTAGQGQGEARRHRLGCGTSKPGPRRARAERGEARERPSWIPPGWGGEAPLLPDLPRPSPRMGDHDLVRFRPPFCGALLQLQGPLHGEGGSVGSRGSPLFLPPRVRPSSAAASPPAPCLPSAKGADPCLYFGALDGLRPRSLSQVCFGANACDNDTSWRAGVRDPSAGPRPGRAWAGRSAGRLAAGARGAHGELGEAAARGPWGSGRGRPGPGAPGAGSPSAPATREACQDGGGGGSQSPLARLPADLHHKERGFVEILLASREAKLRRKVKFSS